MHVGGDRDLPGRRVGADQPAHEEVALHVVGLVGVDDDADQQPALDEPEVLGRERLDRLAQLLQRRLARQLADHVALGGGDRQLGADRRRALRDHRQHLDAVEPHADRALGDDLVADEQHGRRRRRVRPDASPPSSGSSGAASVRKRSTASVGNVTGSASRIAPSAPDEVRHAGQRAGALLELLDRRVERRRGAVAEARRPDRDRGARLDLAPVADHAARAAPDQPVRGEDLVDRLERRLRRRRGAPRRRRRSRDRTVSPPSSVGRRGRRLERAVRASGTVERPVPMRTGMFTTDDTARLAAAGERRRARARAARAARRATARRGAPAILAPVRVIAVFGPTGVGKTAVAIALAERLRAHGEDPVAVSADAMQVYDGLPILTGAATPERAAAARAPPDRLRARHRDVLRRRLRQHAPTQRSTSCSRSGRRPIVVGGTGLYLRAALADLDLRPPVDPTIRARCERQLRPTASSSCTPQLPAEQRHRARPTRQRILRALELLDAGHELPPAAARALAAVDRRDTRHPTLLAALVDGPRRARTPASSSASTRCSRPARNEEVERGRRRRRLHHRARRARLRGAARRRRRGHEAPAPAATPSASSPGCASCPDAHLIDITDRTPEDVARRADRHDLALVRFEKWQALGNDYLIFEGSELTPRPDPPAVRPALRAGRRRRAAARAARRARLRRPAADLQPRRQRGRAVGQRRPRGDPVPAPQRLDGQRTRSRIQTLAGEIRPTITGPTTCRVDMGRAQLQRDALPGRPAGRPGRDRPGLRASSTSTIGNPQCAIRVRGPRRDRPAARSARPSRTRRSSPTARTSRSGREIDAAHHPRADLRARRGGDALLRDRRARARPSPTCSGAATRRSPSAGRRRARGRRRRVAARRPHGLGGPDLPRRAERGAGERAERRRRQLNAAGDRSDGHDRDGGPARAQGPRRRGPRARARRDQGAPPARPRLRAGDRRPRRPAHARRRRWTASSAPTSSRRSARCSPSSSRRSWRPPRRRASSTSSS